MPELAAALTRQTTSPGAQRIVLAYAGFSAAWILLSDRLMAWVFRDPEGFALASTLKGWFFVLVTSLLLLGLLRRWAGARPAAAEAGHAWRFPGLAFVPLAILIVISAGFSVSYTLGKHRDTEVARLQAIADLKVVQISDWLGDREEQARFIRNSESFTQEYYRWQGAGNPASGERLIADLAQLRRTRGFNQVMLLDPSGRYLWSSADTPHELAPALRAAADEAARDGQIHRVGPYLDVDGQPRLDFVGAFPASLGAPPIVVLRTDPSDWLYSTLQAWPVPSESGETLLFRREGEEIVFLNRLRYRTEPMLRLPVTAADGDTLAVQVLRGEARPGESVSGVDYHGTAAIGVVRAIGGTDWVLVAKMDRGEILQTALRDLVWIALATLLALAVARVMVSLLRQREQLVLAQGVQHSQTERLRVLSLLGAIADGSEDAIFAKDCEGRYTLCNKAACRFVGKPEEEVLGRDDRALFPPEQAEMLMARDRQLIAEDHPLTLEELLTTAKGDRLFLATKGPLRDADGKVLGIFGIARDITGRKDADLALRESESRFRALVEQTLAGIYIIQDGVFRYVNQGFAEIFGYASPEAVVERLTVAEFTAPEDRARVQASIKGRLDGSGDIHYTFTALRSSGARIEVEVHGRGFEYLGRRAVIGLILDISARKASEEALRRQADELARRNAELERFNRVMVGRELDMLALKQQVNALSQTAGKSPPYSLSFVDSLAVTSSIGEQA